MVAKPATSACRGQENKKFKLTFKSLERETRDLQPQNRKLWDGSDLNILIHSHPIEARLLEKNGRPAMLLQ